MDSPAKGSSYPPMEIPTKGEAGKKIIGVLIILFFFVVIGSVVGASIYFATRPPLFKQISVTPCSSGTIVVPTTTPGVSPPDGVSCYALSGYNNYPGATIHSPTMTSSETVFSDLTSFSEEGSSPAPMTGVLCMDHCDRSSGCVTAVCTYPENVSECSCSGYNAVPSALLADPCEESCTNVYIKSSAI